MKNIMEQYGSALISAISGLLVIGLLFTGLLPGSGGLLRTIGKETMLVGGTAGYGASEDYDLSFIRAAGEDSGLSLADIEVENYLTVNTEYLVDSVVRSHSGQEIRAKARRVEMLSVAGTGADVTYDVLSIDELGRQTICLDHPGSYRVSLVIENPTGMVISGNFVITAEKGGNGELAAFA